MIPTLPTEKGKSQQRESLCSQRFKEIPERNPQRDERGGWGSTGSEEKGWLMGKGLSIRVVLAGAELHRDPRRRTLSSSRKLRISFTLDVDKSLRSNQLALTHPGLANLADGA
jgi:hypothetical protein